MAMWMKAPKMNLWICCPAIVLKLGCFESILFSQHLNQQRCHFVLYIDFRFIYIRPFFISGLSTIKIKTTKYQWLYIYHHFGNVCFSCWTFIFSCKEVDGPYAWRGVLKFQRDYCGHSGDGLVDGDDSQKTIDTPMDGGPPDFQTSLQHLIAQASAISSIHFALPKSNAVAGAVLAHAIKIVEKQFSQHDPMIFKLGFTHNPHWRWCNRIYGYGHDVEKWSTMMVLYAAPEPFSPAMLEAALIEKYQGTLAAFGH